MRVTGLERFWMVIEDDLEGNSILLKNGTRDCVAFR